MTMKYIHCVLSVPKFVCHWLDSPLILPDLKAFSSTSSGENEKAKQHFYWKRFSVYKPKMVLLNNPYTHVFRVRNYTSRGIWVYVPGA